VRSYRGFSAFTTFSLLLGAFFIDGNSLTSSCPWSQGSRNDSESGWQGFHPLPLWWFLRSDFPSQLRCMHLFPQFLASRGLRSVSVILLLRPERRVSGFSYLHLFFFFRSTLKSDLGFLLSSDAPSAVSLLLVQIPAREADDHPPHLFSPSPPLHYGFPTPLPRSGLYPPLASPPATSPRSTFFSWRCAFPWCFFFAFLDRLRLRDHSSMPPFLSGMTATCLLVKYNDSLSDNRRSSRTVWYPSPL